VIGNERAGLEPEVLEKLDRVAEIPMAGMPHSLNAATSASIAIYEYCRRHPPRGGAVPEAGGSAAAHPLAGCARGFAGEALGSTGKRSPR